MRRVAQAEQPQQPIQRKSLLQRSVQSAESHGASSEIETQLSSLTEKGKRMAAMKYSDKKTDEQIKKGLDSWIWEHPSAAAQGRNYQYYSN